MNSLINQARQDLRHQPVSVVMTRGVYSVTPETPLLELTTEMRKRRISCVVVCIKGRPVGIVSERDVVRILCETSKPAAQLNAGMVMSQPIQTISPEMLCPAVMHAMRQKGFRRFPVVDGTGRLVGLVTQTDLLRASERDLAEYTARLERAIEQKAEELAQITLLKDDLTSMIVHDMKNPLAVVLGILESMVVGRKPLEDQKLRKRLGLALEAGRSMLRMVLNLLDITKIEAGELKPERAHVLGREMLERGLQPVLELASRDGIEVKVLSQLDEHRLYLDSGLIERLLQNLVSNAIKFSPPSEAVEISSWVDFGSSPATWHFTVSNWGPPIAPEYHEKIFDKFAQLEAKRSGNIASTGLGLTFCRLAIEAHGGRIWVDSPLAADRGVRFTCVVPLG